MPSAFLRPCQYPGCRKYATKGSCYCEEHTRNVERDTAPRVSSYRQGYTKAWQRARKAFLIDHPLCVECMKQGRYTPATEVDHIKPHKGDKNLFWDIHNWQSLCHACHSRKTAREDGGFGNHGRTTT
jgi:5-methylcytosine-specific restriction protein A